MKHDTNSYVEAVSISIVREYLHRKGYTLTLRVLNKESKAIHGISNRRVRLAQELGLVQLLRQNKTEETPLVSMFEVLVKKYFLYNSNKQTCASTSTQTCQTDETQKTDCETQTIPFVCETGSNGISTTFTRLESLENFMQSSGLRLGKSNTSPGSRSPVDDEGQISDEDDLASQPALFKPTRTNRDKSTERSQVPKSGSRRGGGDINAISLAESVFLSKQNMLAQMSLSPEELSRTQQWQNNKCESLCDIEDEDLFGDTEKKPVTGANKLFSKKSDWGCEQIQLDGGTIRKLKACVLGPHGHWSDGWNQGFYFNSKISYGLVQERGGPCGVLSAVQALIIRNLLFGSKFCDPSKLPLATLNVLTQKSDTIDKETIQDALDGALTEILWRCSSITKKVMICRDNSSFGTSTVCFTDQTYLKDYIKNHELDCISFVYSVVLSRGLEKVLEDIDFEGSTLIGQYGYCSQELMNLLLIGMANSNAFDSQIELDGKILKGVPCRSDIGLLSLYEHYGSYKVGDNFKSPKFPIWIVGSESHFTVLFSPDVDFNEMNKETFHLLYYDGLARQNEIVQLTINVQNEKSWKSDIEVATKDLLTVPDNGLGTNVTNNTTDDDLVPPLEKCIRTKWKNAIISWNGTEPIL